MPQQPRTGSLRIDPVILKKIKLAAVKEGRTITAVVEDALRRYLADYR